MLMEKLLQFSNHAMGWACLGLALSVVLAYPLAGSFSLATQIAAHLATLLFAVGIKLAYVARLVCLKQLGRPIH